MGKRRFTSPNPSGPSSLLGAVPEDRLDLHGENAVDAVRKLGWFIDRWEHLRPGAVLEVVTGRGNRSPGAPVLQPTIQRALDKEFADRIERWVHQPGGGAFLIRLRKRST